eukprot:37446-Pleurochrysis_carterae.AAC.3
MLLFAHVSVLLFARTRVLPIRLPSAPLAHVGDERPRAAASARQLAPRRVTPHRRRGARSRQRAHALHAALPRTLARTERRAHARRAARRPDHQPSRARGRSQPPAQNRTQRSAPTNGASSARREGASFEYSQSL